MSLHLYFGKLRTSRPQMACLTNYKFLKTKPPIFCQRLWAHHKPSPRVPTKDPYEIPKRYKESFYLANAAFYDSSNYYLHKAYEALCPTLKEQLKEAQPDKLYFEDEVAEKVENIIRVLNECNSIIDVRFPVKRDSGSYEVIRGFRAQYGLGIGYMSCLGGLRINGDITRDHMKALSVLSAYKHACMGFNMGGAHGGIKICPKDYSENELQNIIELYVTELIKKGYCNAADVVQPDLYTSEREMAWISKSYSNITGDSLCVAATGKPVDMGGIENYDKMSSRGAFLALNFFLNNDLVMEKVELAKGLEGKTFIIQGLGKLGTPLAERLVNNGAICVGVKEHDAYIYEAKGLDLKKLLEHRTHTGSIRGFGTYKTDESDVIYTEDCDMLVFASSQKSLVCYIARDVKAKVILEAADGPLTPTSDAILTSKSKLVVPDIYACSGAAVTSYIEYLKNMQQTRRFNDSLLKFSHNIYENILNRISENEEQVAVSGSSVQRVSNVVVPNVLVDSLDCILSEVGNEILKKLELYKLGTDVRTAAYMVAIQNVFNTLLYQKRFL